MVRSGTGSLVSRIVVNKADKINSGDFIRELSVTTEGCHYSL